MNVWTISYYDEQDEEQIVGFAHTPEAATALAQSHLLDHDLDLALPWKRVEDNVWKMVNEDDSALYLTQS